MARASKDEVERTVNVLRGVNLNLTVEEAQFLADVTSRIGGDSTHSRRKHADDIARALAEIDIHYGDMDDVKEDYSGGGMFFNDPNETPSRTGCGCA